MKEPPHLSFSLFGDRVDDRHTVQAAITVVVFIILTAYFLYKLDAPNHTYPNIPLIGKKPGEWSSTKAKARWVTSARQIISAGLAQVNAPFQVLATVRPMIILPARYIDEIKNDDRLDFAKAVENAFYGRYPGFEGLNSLNQNDVFQHAVKVRLTQSLHHLTVPLVEEVNVLLREIFPPSKEWKPCVFGHHAAPMIARLSSLAFLGPKFCRNQKWLSVSVNYTLDVFNAARVLNLWPPLLRPVAVRFLPETRKLRAHLRNARSVIEPELAARAQKREEDVRAGFRIEEHHDALEWFSESSETMGKPLDITLAQMSLSIAAIHITSQLLINVMYDMAAYPEYVDALRAELSRVLEEDGGWKSTTPAKLKLMDSVIKESQRMSPSSMITMHRFVERHTKLSDGTRLPQGAWVTVAATVQKDPQFWSEPDTYDGFRFYNLRQQPGNENRYQSTTTGPEQIGFGMIYSQVVQSKAEYKVNSAGIISPLLKVRLELVILLFNESLVDVGKKSNGDDSAQVAHASGEVKWNLALLDEAAAAVLNQMREDVVANEATELSKGGGNAVELSTDGCGGGLGCDQTDVVTGTHFTEGEEDSRKDDNEAGNVCLGIQVFINARHDESNGTLERDTEDQAVLGSEVITQESTDERTGDVEGVDGGSPAKGDPQGGGDVGVVFGVQDELQPRRGENTERVGQHVVDEPNDTDGGQTEPVVSQDQSVWVFGHLGAVVLLGLVDLGTGDQQENGQDGGDAEADTPRRSQVVLGGCEHDDHGNQRSGGESQIELEVGCEDEPPVTRAGLQLDRGLGCGYTTCGVFSTNAHTDEHTVCRQRGGHASEGTMVAISTGRQGSEDNHDGGGDQERLLSGPVITEDTEANHTHDGTNEGEGGQVGTGRGVGEGGAINRSEDGGDGANDLHHGSVTFHRPLGGASYTLQVAVGEQSSTAGKDRPGSLPERLGHAVDHEVIGVHGRLVPHGLVVVVVALHGGMRRHEGERGSRDWKRGANRAKDREAARPGWRGPTGPENVVLRLTEKLRLGVDFFGAAHPGRDSSHALQTAPQIGPQQHTAYPGWPLRPVHHVVPANSIPAASTTDRTACAARGLRLRSPPVAIIPSRTTSLDIAHRLTDDLVRRVHMDALAARRRRGLERAEGIRVVVAARAHNPTKGVHVGTAAHLRSARARRGVALDRVARVEAPEVGGEERAEDRDVDGDDADKHLADPPPVDVQRRRVRAQREHDADDGRRDDEDPGREQEEDDQFPRPVVRNGSGTGMLRICGAVIHGVGGYTPGGD
ncbi:hypothetical protein BP6252_11382 [Coleophoma cylindrospora]|uniref:Ent-kaurene oxidase n=1 Tax=Coleophoma cylindrospora TaxID=1849047 RepID=A0A3D8QJJ0_9HELO|nr:hypothetical protein BP6252_11382 [Coleophoma cylindrospora]